MESFGVHLPRLGLVRSLELCLVKLLADINTGLILCSEALPGSGKSTSESFPVVIIVKLLTKRVENGSTAIGVY